MLQKRRKYDKLILFGSETTQIKFISSTGSKYFKLSVKINEKQATKNVPQNFTSSVFSLEMNLVHQYNRQQTTDIDLKLHDIVTINEEPTREELQNFLSLFILE